MKAFVTLPTFETRITACHDDDSFTLAWLMQWVMSILDLIGLYIPEHKKCYNQLLKSVEPPLEGIGQLSARFGLFSANSPGRAYDVTVGVSDQPPQPLLA